MIFRELRPTMAAIFFVAIISIIFSCEKPETGIGGNLLPDEDNLDLFFTDTISVVAFNSPEEDSVRTSPVTTGLIGSYHDPIMGIHRSELYFQLRLPASNISFGADETTIVLDSIVLGLDYTGGFYGELNPLTFEVYELNEDIELDSIYYSNDEFETISTNIADPQRATISPTPTLPTIDIGDEEVANQIRIHLDTTWGYMFFDPLIEDSLATTDLFLQWFKGLHVKTQADNSAILNVDLTNGVSALTLYYQEQEPDTTIYKEFAFLINDNSQRINHFEHDYSASLVQYYLDNPELGQQRLFVQGGAGQSIELDFPFIDGWLDSSNVAVNNAELILPIEDVKSGLFLPARLFTVRIDEDGEEATIPDAFQGDTHLGGFLDLENQEYRLNITRYLQQVITGELENRGLRIKPSFNGSSFNRASIFGFENPEKRAKLVFTYTKF